VQHGVANGDTGISSDLEQELTRDPRQQPRVERRRQRHTALDDE